LSEHGTKTYLTVVQLLSRRVAARPAVSRSEFRRATPSDIEACGQVDIDSGRAIRAD
jgi:hypothetical protein